MTKKIAKTAAPSTASTKVVKPAPTLASTKAEIDRREAERVAAIAAKNLSAAKYARHCLRRARALLATLQAAADAKKSQKPAPKAKVVKTPAPVENVNA